MNDQSHITLPFTLTRRHLLIGAVVTGGLAACSFLRPHAAADPATQPPGQFAVTHTDAEWHQLLNAQQYRVLRQAGTELPYTSALNDEHRNGIFGCAGCNLDLFDSKTKFDSGTGWPSFFKALVNAVLERSDHSLLGTDRTEVLCRQCGGHLGHVFDDGPQPTGLRYCMNGVALTFRAT
ncbi:peptide-methionine (R)-S-oxide reductase MsrB [Mycolicibacterium sp. CBMA 226]|uniref:peptide-methionine (R)-S-oxide reductase MsrB n=1 Tax=Mycolicibacterium sp. CBMA 226 TaxID=2606611 RepID=UPI0012DBEC02|nr:peptide-methionine (R)-S-oxide reductase MsrB [Mycolicibacterium sp. CBMA 226]MUL77147.1 peptide-methionine (R)-S-oxide reductase MsrB [Mycolicibacterium sp. CBMA 226]